ncbi:lipid-A-disaccharide synthase [Halorhodospira halochloris]|uniref:lipid-A-disaccharide synthase n=1 Tax=Halorhodospira halochloris TaxID=1052 RepID=UPI001EE7E8AC|nr:lipid-A-disaccharide synthase [Halorhodospira halochloris]MCG5547667.1 lipid-A-disaccharide synthase [Halorhodospira halochloris]
MAGPRIALLAGELSGDVLGAGLMRALAEYVPGAEYEGVGGPAMEAAGLQRLAPMEGLALMGLTEVVGHLPRLLGLRRQLVNHWIENPPDIFIGIDLPDFNLSVEKRLRSAGITTVHYVSPSVWAWRRGRIKTIRRAVDRMLTLYPFEQSFYDQSGVDAVCVGHPAADRFPLQVDRVVARQSLELSLSSTVVAILPGSRGSEVSRLISEFAAAAAILAEGYDDTRFVVPVASEHLREEISAEFERHGLGERLTLVAGDAARVATSADVAIVASGTATLEVMLAKCPMVVAYRVSWLTYYLVKAMIKVQWVSQPNLLAQESLVVELFQGQACASNLAAEAGYWLDKPHAAQQLRQRFTTIHADLARNADQRAAQAVLEKLK